MHPLKDLTEGLKILEPFLKRHGFTFDNYRNDKGSGGQFTVATYSCGRKRFIIGYRYSVGELAYQLDNFIVGHSFYLDHLGYADQKLFPNFQSDDKLLAFKHILHDFEFLIDDFFNGSCHKLIEAAKMQDKFVLEFNEKARQEHYILIDQEKMARARLKFKEKDYKGTLEIYNTVERKILLSDLDKKTIEYCKRHI